MSWRNPGRNCNFIPVPCGTLRPVKRADGSTLNFRFIHLSFVLFIHPAWMQALAEHIFFIPRREILKVFAFFLRISHDKEKVRFFSSLVKVASYLEQRQGKALPHPG